MQYTYDSNNRLSAIEIPGQQQITYNTYQWNSPTRITLPGGSTTDYTYDPLMRLKSITARDPGQNTVMSRGYTYSSVGNITTKQTEHGNYAYGYDDLYRLINAVNPTLPDEAYTYDKVGNRLTSAATMGEWTYNANNEIQGFDNVTFQHDLNGNMTQKNDDGDIKNYIYDVEDRIVRVEDENSNIIALYYYDPFGRRLWKEVSGTKTYYAYSDEGLVGEYNEAGQEIKAYGYEPNSTFTSNPLFQRINNTYYWYQNDHQGTPQKIIATNGLIVWSAVYDSFGNCQVDIEGITNNLRLPGQYYDAETGLHYNLNRYYDPQIGRYLRPDPYGEGINLYAYCFNNPTKWVDPLGLCILHPLLGVAGMIPLFGIIPDLLDAVLYLLEGDYAGFAMAGLAAIPIVGLFTRGGQYLYKFSRLAMRYGPDIMNVVRRFSDNAGTVYRYATDLLSRAINIGYKYTRRNIERIGARFASQGGDETGRYIYRTISKNDPHCSQFNNIGDKGFIKPHGGHNDLTRHVQEGDTNSIFTSWSKSKDVNWEQWGGENYIQLRVDTWKMKNHALDVSEWSNFPWEQEVSVLDIVENVERIR